MGKCINKKIAAVLLSLALAVGLFGIVDINVYADNEYPSGGLLQPEVIYKEISEEEYSEILEEEASKQTDSETLRLYKGNDSYWSKFSAPHYYYTNSLTSAQKTLYNNLYNTLYGMIDGGSDCTDGFTPAVSYSGLTRQQASDVVELIMYGRPELYFLNAVRFVSYTSSNAGSVRIGVYDDFATAYSRAVAAANIRNKIDGYLAQVSDSASAYDKEKKIHDLLIANCRYGNEDTTPYSQSCASVFLNNNGETVCAGYSEAFCMLCYAKGILAYSITSSAHEWSQVKLGNYWYAVDVTWDDSSSSYKHFNKSDATMLNLGRTDHTIEALWSRVGRDACLYDYGSESGKYSSTIYRLYNPNSGEHFYTSNYLEKENLNRVGWNYEGIGWSAPISSSIPVYRMYNPNAGDHHYTMNYNEAIWLENVGWNYEGIGWYSADSNNTVLYRLYNPNAITGAHHYTMNSYERDMLVRSGWNYEGIAWYGL